MRMLVLLCTLSLLPAPGCASRVVNLGDGDDAVPHDDDDLADDDDIFGDDDHGDDDGTSMTDCQRLAQAFDGQTPPNTLPTVTVETFGDNPPAEGCVLTTIIAGQPMVVVLDLEGHYLWWHTPGPDIEKLTRAWLSRVSEHVIYLDGIDGDSSLVFTDLDGVKLGHIPAPDATHDFLELPDGTLAVIALDSREVDGDDVDGHRIVEYALNGTSTEIFTVWDHEEYDGETPLNADLWSHCNALDYLASSDEYLLSCLGFSTLYRIDRATGDVVSRIGGDRSDLELLTGELFHHQHQFQLLDDGLLVFDNGQVTEMSSRVVEYGVDEDAGTLTQRWQYHADPPMLTGCLGDVTRFDSGETMVIWGSSGMIELLDADGSVTHRLNMALGGGLGYGSWLGIR